MTHVPGPSQLGTVAEVLENLPPRAVPLITEDAGIEEVVDAFSTAPHSRLIYVVDGEQRLLGIIALGDLARHLFFHYQGNYIDARSLVSIAACENARDLMQREPIAVRPEQKVEEAIELMMGHNIKELPVVDAGSRVIADLTLIDLLRHCKKKLGSFLGPG